MPELEASQAKLQVENLTQCSASFGNLARQSLLSHSAWALMRLASVSKRSTLAANTRIASSCCC